MPCWYENEGGESRYNISRRTIPFKESWIVNYIFNAHSSDFSLSCQLSCKTKGRLYFMVGILLSHANLLMVNSVSPWLLSSNQFWKVAKDKIFKWHALIYTEKVFLFSWCNTAATRVPHMVLLLWLKSTSKECASYPSYNRQFGLGMMATTLSIIIWLCIRNNMQSYQY
jgi:hypothetical protein